MAVPCYLWVDDVRVPEEHNGVQYTDWVKSSQEAILFLDTAKWYHKPIELISFDHDLSETSDDDAMSVLVWIQKNNFWPSNMRFHTGNPVGWDNMVKFATHYAPDTCWVDPRWWWENYG